MERYEFGNRVAQLRKEKGLTQAELAERLGVSNKTISRWETGDGYPDMSLLKPLANVLEVSIDYLLGNETSGSVKIADIHEYKFEEDKLDIKNKELNFDWKHPRWADLTTWNKVAAATVVGVVLYNILWWILAALVGSEFLNFLVVLNVIIIKYLPLAGIICAGVGMIRGEKGLVCKQHSVSRVLLVANVVVPILCIVLPLITGLAFQGM